MCWFRKMSEPPHGLSLFWLGNLGLPRLNFIKFLPNLEFPGSGGRRGGGGGGFILWRSVGNKWDCYFLHLLMLSVFAAAMLEFLLVQHKVPRHCLKWTWFCFASGRGGTSSFSWSLSWGVGLSNSNSLTGVGSTASDGPKERRFLLRGSAAEAIALSWPKTLARRSSMSILSGVTSSGSTPGTSVLSGDFTVLSSYLLSFSVGVRVPLLYLSRITFEPQTNRYPLGWSTMINTSAFVIAWSSRPLLNKVAFRL